MKQKILLVDDREDNLFSMETILEADGYELVKANSGRQALKILLSEFNFALILMDVKMPNMNGFETAALIYEREKLKHIPIIFITANSYGDDHIFRGYRLGAVDYIYKPINPELLRIKVGVFVDLYTKNYQLQAHEQKLIVINKSLENEIHERKVSEEKVVELNHQLLESVQRLETVNKELDRFAFMSSHDLQEPLRKIRIYSDFLFVKRKEMLDEEAIKYVQRIQNSAERMQNLIKDILEFSKISNSPASLVKTDLNTLVQEVLFDIQDIITAKKAEVIVGDLPELDVIPGLFRPLLSNLIENALKYSKKDVAPVINIYSEVSMNMRDSSANNLTTTTPFCRIYVQDNGIGFDQRYAEQIFDMFKRLHGNSEYEGTGIGLALCKRIIEKHNGFISALSQDNQGTTFIISLPLKATNNVYQNEQVYHLSNK
ncbi:MAG TPA: response regulator [Ferruginibacter sp.]|jgi:signal transduction histidine kinase|nr:response regulator [Ferruginibacter sp.]